MIEELIKKARSYRRFDESFKIDYEIIKNIVYSLRLISSARNAQPLKYVISVDKSTNQEIFETLKWAGYLKDWDAPSAGERPSAYIIILRDRSISTEDFSLIDSGIAIQTIMLSLSEKGLGGCVIASIDKNSLRQILSLNDNIEILCAAAIGKPIENIIITDVGIDGDIKYYRDEKGNHYVPKRSVKELLYKSYK